MIDGMMVLQADFDKLTDIACSWNLSLHVGKCVSRFSRRFVGGNVGNELEYKIGYRSLEIVENHRDVRVIVDSGLKFHIHVRDLVRKAAGLARNLLRSTVNRSEFMVALFVSHVRPILDYCSCIWNVGYVSDLTLLETVQRRWT